MIIIIVIFWVLLGFVTLIPYMTPDELGSFNTTK
jgi:hypothetical protein